MSTWKLVKLNFGRSPAHFGEVGIGIEETSERVRSDTLFSAWISTYARLFGKDAVEELLQQFRIPSSPPMRMSSTFIYRQAGERTIYYLPRPLKFPRNYPEGDDLKFFKAYKKLNHLPIEVWQRWYQGEGFIPSDRDELIAEMEGKPNGNLRQAGTFDYKETFKTDVLPKVAIDRVTRATNFYHTGYLQFQWEHKERDKEHDVQFQWEHKERDKEHDSDIKSLSGLYFLIHFPKTDDQLADKLQAAVHLLGEEGLGGERSSGAGRFKVQWLDLPKDLENIVSIPDQPVHYCLISLFWDNEPATLAQLITDTNDASYEIVERGGWIASPFSGHQLRRQMVRMFSEGSVFPAQPIGKLADVTPTPFKTHTIYRNGIALSLPIKVSAQSKSQT